MLISNFSRLAQEETRRHALEIINAGMEAVLTKNAMRQVSLEGSILKVKGEEFNLDEYENVYVIGGGKASADMAEAIERLLGGRIKEGIVTDVVHKELRHIEVVKGDHPVPSQANMEAASRMVEIAEKANEKDLVICLVSGGGSAILAYPRCNLEYLKRINSALLKSGADIYKVNAVRKHISRIKGGQLSRTSHPATVISMIFSDVLGNDLSVIASGPTVKDKSTMDEVRKIIEDYSLPKLRDQDFEETPKEDHWFEKTHNILLLDNSVAVQAMREKAEELGYQAEILGYELDGEAKETGKDLAGKIKPSAALIAAGETTVTVKGSGKGGRNQELALGAIGNFASAGCVVSVGTDGIDNTPAAGAISCNDSDEKAKKLRLDASEYLGNNDAYRFFEQMGDLIITGPTGTNVADIMLALGKKE